jgi:hypothetical protein
VTITGLQPTGTAILGNEPYAVDNLVSAAEPRLTTHGFGFSLANGDYANPFYNGSTYYEYLSVPAYVKGAGPERPISFSAALCAGAKHILTPARGSRQPHRLRPNLSEEDEERPFNPWRSKLKRHQCAAVPFSILRLDMLKGAKRSRL